MFTSRFLRRRRSSDEQAAAGSRAKHFPWARASHLIGDIVRPIVVEPIPQEACSCSGDTFTRLALSSWPKVDDRRAVAVGLAVSVMIAGHGDG